MNERSDYLNEHELVCIHNEIEGVVNKEIYKKWLKARIKELTERE